MEPERIAIHHHEGNIANNPHLAGFARLLHESGYRVDVFSHSHASCPYQQAGQEHYSLFLLPEGQGFPLFTHSYVFIFGVDEGIVDAKRHADFLDVAYAHISYEIFFDDELKDFPEDRAAKRLAKEALRQSCFSLVPDAVRAQQYCLEYAVAAEKIILSPVAEADLVPAEKTTYLHQLFGLEDNCKILLSMGSVSDWSMAGWLAEQAPTLPEGWVLVFHDRYGKAPPFRPKNAANVFFSTSPAASPEELAELIRSASCCVALYRPTYAGKYTGKNLQYIGLASGKFSTALRHGVPILVDGGEMARLVTEYDAGVVCSPGAGDTLSVLADLPSDDALPRRCQRLFDERLNLRNCMPEVFALLEKQKRKPRLAAGETDSPVPQLEEAFARLRKIGTFAALRCYGAVFRLMVSDIFFRIQKKIRRLRARTKI